MPVCRLWTVTFPLAEELEARKRVLICRPTRLNDLLGAGSQSPRYLIARVERKALCNTISEKTGGKISWDTV
jgi:hypothetical protein